MKTLMSDLKKEVVLTESIRSELFKRDKEREECVERANVAEKKLSKAIDKKKTYMNEITNL